MISTYNIDTIKSYIDKYITHVCFGRNDVIISIDTRDSIIVESVDDFYIRNVEAIRSQCGFLPILSGVLNNKIIDIDVKDNKEATLILESGLRLILSDGDPDFERITISSI